MTMDSILAKYGIDNLQLSMDLTTAARTFFTETEAGNNPVTVRQRIEAAMQTGATRAAKMDDMESRVYKATGLRVSEGWHRDGVMDFLLNRDAEGQTIEVFANACWSDPYGMPKFHQIAAKPALLIANWGLAFMNAKKTDETQPQYKPFTRDEEHDKNIVPNPYRKPLPRPVQPSE